MWLPRFVSSVFATGDTLVSSEFLFSEGTLDSSSCRLLPPWPVDFSPALWDELEIKQLALALDASGVKKNDTFCECRTGYQDFSRSECGGTLR